jgi:divalent metal cation (Fe/Co/Zn/Cd) transporter
MTTMTTTGRPTRTTAQLRTGLALSAFLGLINIPFLFVPTPDGQDGPPTAVLVLSALIGLVSVVCAVVAWRSGNRLAIRINAAALLINALTSLPAFFVDVDAWIKVGAAVSVILTVVALVLTLRREPAPYTVTD